jgi:hypothetical protein
MTDTADGTHSAAAARLGSTTLLSMIVGADDRNASSMLGLDRT